jgi:hypothetical protein
MSFAQTTINQPGTNTVSVAELNLSDGTAGQFITTDGNGTISFASGYTDSDVETYLNTSEIYTDPTNNRLGIGAASPDAVLTTVNSGALTLDSNDSDHSGFGLLIEPSTITANTVNSAIGFARSSGRKYAAIGMQTYADVDQNGLNFYVQTTASGSSASLTEAMRIDSSGNVGINRTSIAQPSAGATTLAIQGTDNNKAGAIRLYSADDSVSAWIYSDSGNGLSLNTATSHPMVFRTSATERLRIDADGIIRARSFRDVGHYLGPDGGVNVADDSTVTITDNVAGAMMVSIYDAGTGSGALYFVNYQGDPQVIKSSGILSFTDDDIDGFLCIYKTGAANSHTTVVKNRTGATRNLYISVFGSTT